MKKDKPNLNLRSARIKGLLVKAGLAVFIISLAISLIIGYIWKALKKSDYFRIKDIIAKESNVVDLSYLKGRNIFSLDLNRESRYILEFLPGCRRIKIIRVLPNRLFIDFIRRKPVALVKLYRFFYLDQESVLFEAGKEVQESAIPVITGLETKIFGAKPGTKYNLKEIALVLNLIKETRENRVIKNYKISRIDVASLGHTSIFVLLPTVIPADPNARGAKKQEALEVKIGQEDIKSKIAILSGLLAQEKSALANIKYIDLRFKEPVIKLKDAK